MHLVVFEDANWIDFAPISITHPVFAARVGLYSLLERQIRAFSPSKLTLWVQPELVEYCKKYLPEIAGLDVSYNTPLSSESAVLVNARFVPDSQIESGSLDGVHIDTHGQLCFAKINSPGLSADDVMQNSGKWQAVVHLGKSVGSLKTARYLWDLLTWNQNLLQKDIQEQLATGKSAAKKSGPFHLVNESQIFMGKNVKLGAGCVLDAEAGAIYLAADVVISPNAVLQGPCYIGPKSQISPLASIRPGANIASQCKVGGEVSNSIFMACSNKAHDGFVGDSYIGQWVNFGAGATTSNLKNTYGSISIRIGSRTISTGKQFLGSLVGDHTKFAIQTRLMTGSYIGYSCMIAVSSLTPTYVPSLTFLTDKGAAKYEIDKAREVMTSVMKRRGREWDAADDAMMKYAEDAIADCEK